MSPSLLATAALRACDMLPPRDIIDMDRLIPPSPNGEGAGAPGVVGRARLENDDDRDRLAPGTAGRSRDDPDPGVEGSWRPLDPDALKGEGKGRSAADVTDTPLELPVSEDVRVTRISTSSLFFFFFDLRYMCARTKTKQNK